MSQVPTLVVLTWNLKHSASDSKRRRNIGPKITHTFGMGYTAFIQNTEFTVGFTMQSLTLTDNPRLEFDAYPLMTG